MILAAAEAARDIHASAPPELSLAWECLEFTALPRGPALWDQPAGLVRRMRICLRVFEAFDMLVHSKDWHQLATHYPRQWAIVSWVKRLEAQQREATNG